MKLKPSERKYLRSVGRRGVTLSPAHRYKARRLVAKLAGFPPDEFRDVVWGLLNWPRSHPDYPKLKRRAEAMLQGLERPVEKEEKR